MVDNCKQRKKLRAGRQELMYLWWWFGVYVLLHQINAPAMFQT